jgi:hypothetical protein
MITPLLVVALVGGEFVAPATPVVVYPPLPAVLQIPLVSSEQYCPLAQQMGPQADSWLA